MSASDTFTNNLIGVHDIRSEGGSLLPRRTTINFVNCVAEDIGGETVITLDMRPVWLTTATLTTSQDDYTATGFAGCTDVPFDSSVATATVTGLDSSGLTVYEKRIWNVDSSNSVALAHASSSSAVGNRIYCPGSADMTIAPGYAAMVVWVSSLNRWQAIQCLA